MSTPHAVATGSGVTELLLGTLGRAEEPLTAVQVRNRLPDQNRPTAAKIGKVLEEQAASGQVARFNPIKGKSPRYWMPGRDEHAGLVEVLLDALRKAEEPRTAKQLIGEVTRARKPSAAEVERLLEERVAVGELHRFGPAKGKDVRYWDRSRGQYSRELLVATLAKGKGKAGAPMTWAELSKALNSRLKGVPEDELSQVLQELLDEGRVYRALKFDSKRPDQYSPRPPDLRAFLAEDFRALYAKYERAGLSRNEVDASALAHLGASPPAGAIEAPRPHLEDPDRVLLETFEELRRERFGHSGLVPIYEIRRCIKERFGPEAARHDALDEQIKRLWRGGKLTLLPINDASRVSLEELNDSIPGAQETWFYLESKS